MSSGGWIAGILYAYFGYYAPAFAAGLGVNLVNFAIIGTQDQIQKAFTAAGWTGVDKTTQDAIVHGLLATLSHEAYT